MNILFVHERFGAFGGAEANIATTAAELARRGHTVGLIHGPSTCRAEQQWSEIFPHRYDLQASNAGGVVQHAVKDFQPDVLYLHKMAEIRILEALIASPVPVVRMVHDHDLYCMRSYKYNVLTRQICTRAASWYCVVPCGAFVARKRGSWLPLRWVSYRAKHRELALNRRCHHFIVGTHYMMDELLRNDFPADLITVCPPVTHAPGGLPAESTFSDRNILLFTGQIIRGKGVDVLLRALAQVTRRFSCHIFGEGNHRPYCEALAQKLGLADRVTFHGFVPQEELVPYYREATAVLMSSVWPEPFGAAGLEGMRFGLPVVAFDAGGIREWLTHGENGFLVPWMDHTRFAARVDQLLEDKSLARSLGARARKMVMHGHTLERYTDAIENVFAQTIGLAPEQPCTP